ncbi:vacuolar protein sorting-associated protein 51 homolog isoform X2 [Apostichopus japonicus]|uniref:vacuolar protein sorting-associated protein 51 homolog isoform X2 n=1 Tax=Stichopus japonicus TaxID=307972 RepID=UPI003AB722F0
MASSNSPADGSPRHRRARNDMLKMYYNMNQEDVGGLNSDPTDINGANFDPQIYLSKVMKEKRLNELIDKEAEMVKQIRSLDSDMQTLVYENYNKFISATDTIRKMKTDFRRMEEEMDRLATNMDSIADFSAKISCTLQERREQISRLSGTHSLLKKLQFLFELPARLKKCIEMRAYGQAVRYYVKTRGVLEQYQHMPSFSSIHRDCKGIVEELRTKLREKFSNKESSARELAECVDLLLQLKEPPDQLCDEFLSHASQKLDEDLEVMQSQIRLHQSPADDVVESDQVEADISPAERFLKNLPVDILEFVDSSCNGFLSDICLVISSYKDLFVHRQSIHTSDHNHESLEEVANNKLGEFVLVRMAQYFQCLEQRVQAEKNTVDNSMLVRALDRFYRRLEAVNNLLPRLNILQRGAEIVNKCATDRVEYYLDGLKKHFAECLTDIRQILCAPKIAGKQEATDLSELLATMQSSIVDQVRTVLTNLKAFITNDVTFSHTSFFPGRFCYDIVREELVIGFLKHVFQVALDLSEGSHDKSSPPAALILILSRLFLDFEANTVNQFVSQVNEQFQIDPAQVQTTAAALCAESKMVAQRMLNHYVKIQGLQISQMLRKSVETRDWLNTIEPRNVRAVMKRVVEDVTFIDSQVGMLYEEGIRKAHSSDSSKRTFQSYSGPRKHQSTARSFTPSTAYDTSLMSNIQKLFSERIEIFSSVEFSKVSVLTGIIKISLKTFLECVRLRTFGRYGLQQIQVDTQYLNLYLWRFVIDEKIVHVMLDEIVGSTVHRCLEPVLMEASIVDVICERS